MRSQQHLVFFNNFRLNFLRFYYTYFPLKQSLIASHYRYLRCKVITFSKGVLSLISRKQLTFLNKLDTVCWFIRHSMAHSASVRLNFSQSEQFRCWTIRFCFKNELENRSKLYSRAFTTVYDNLIACNSTAAKLYANFLLSIRHSLLLFLSWS